MEAVRQRPLLLKGISAKVFQLQRLKPEHQWAWVNGSILKTLGQMTPIAAQWQAVHGRSLTDSDVDDMYEDFMPVLLDILRDYAKLIPGVAETAVYLQERGIKVAGTTGYFEEAMNICCEEAAKQGYTPDFSLCATQVSAGRPAPWLIYQVMNKLNIFPPEAVVKVGDTKPDIQAGLNAGVWTVGVAKTGNEVGLSQEELSALPQDEQTSRILKAKQTLANEGAHYIVESVADLPAIIDQIEAQIRLGAKP